MVSISTFCKSDSYSKQNFVLNNDSKVYLDITEETTYNGSIKVTVTSGDPVNATVNGLISLVTISTPQTLPIDNVSSIYFELSNTGYSEGYFELSLNVNVNTGNNTTLRIALGVLAAVIIIFSFISYYIRSKKLETTPDKEEAELGKDETTKKRQEAAGAQQRYLGLDEKK